jgi:hypothetical protein
MTQILITKKFEQEIVFESSVSLDPDPEPDPDWAKMLDPDPY